MTISATDNRFIFFHTCTTEGTENTIIGEVELQLSSRGSPSDSEINQASKTALKTFGDNLARVQKLFKEKRLINRIQPIMFSLSGYEFVYLFLKTRLEEYLLDNPEDIEIMERWKEFRLTFGQLVFNRDPARTEQALSFLEYISQKLALYHAENDQSYSDMASIFQEICRDPDLFNLSLQLLCNRGTSSNSGLTRKVISSVEVNVSVVDLQQTYYLLLREFKINLPWLIEAIEKKIAPHMVFFRFIPTPYGIFYSPTLEYSQASMLSETDEVSVIEKASNIQLSFGNRYIAAFKALKKLTSMIDGIQRDSIDEILKTRNNFKKIDNWISALVFGDWPIFGDYQGLINIIIQNPNQFGTNAEKLINALKASNECFLLTRSYLATFWKTICLLHNTFIAWSEHIRKRSLYRSQKNYFEFLKSIPRVIQMAEFMTSTPYQKLPISLSSVTKVQASSSTLTSISSSTTKTDIDALTAFIQGTAKRSNHKKKTPRSKKNSSKRIPPNVLLSEHPQSNVAAVSISVPASSSSSSSQPPLSEASVFSPSSIEDRILATLLELIKRQPSDTALYLKSSLRQVELTFSHLVTFNQKVCKKTPEAFNNYHYHMMISRMYYLIEQVLRYKNIERDPSSGDFSHHVLQRLQDLGIQNHPKTTIVKKLRTANLWVPYTSNQMTSHQLINMVNDCSRKVVIPPILSNLYRISCEVSLQLRHKLKNELNTLYLETLEFVEFLIPVEEKQSLEFELKTCMFQLNDSFNFVMIRKLQRNLDTSIKLCEQKLTHEATDKLQQARKGLKFLKQTLKELNFHELNLHEFSFYLRDAINLTNHICESVLQTFLAVKHNINNNEHNLDRLVELSTGTNFSENIKFFQMNFHGIHTDSRYPFDHGKIRSSLHQLILEAELLRERGELEDEFRMVSESSSTHSNFIKLPKTAFTSAKIWGEASEILSTALNFVFDEILPQLESSLSEKTVI